MENKNRNEHLAEFYAFIIETMDPEKIFCLPPQNGTAAEKDYADVLITVPDIPVKSLLEVEIAIKFATLNYRNLLGTISETFHLDKMIRCGNIYFNVACSEQNLVYNKLNWKKPEMNKGAKAEMKARADATFYKGMQKANVFYSTAKICQEHHAAMSAFLLHQATEICLRTLMKALIGKDKNTHRIQELLIYSTRYHHELVNMITDGSKEDDRQLKLLDNAYQGYRYADDYKIEEKDLTTLMERVAHLHQAVERTFMDWMKRYEMIPE